MANMSCGHLGIMIDDIPLVPNIILSSETFFHNHLSFQINGYGNLTICKMFILLNI